ncbi:hypothetical protein BDZ89DRAFT_1212844 [Hymenopellis radicata]|nr:hypothetical protein BDZ89DRAFT_1212844 [Hymenopellis radicata]
MSSTTSSLTELGSRLPYELIEIIIREAWLSHNLTLRERMDMFTSFSLVGLDFAWSLHASSCRTFTSSTMPLQTLHTVRVPQRHRLSPNDEETWSLSGRTHVMPEHHHPLPKPSRRSRTRHRYVRGPRQHRVHHPAKFPRYTTLGSFITTDRQGRKPCISFTPKQVDVLEVTQVMSAKLASHSREEDFKLSTLPRQWRYSVTKAELLTFIAWRCMAATLL